MLLTNRINKNYRHISKWAKRTNTDAFRIYDRDIGKYPIAIDFYAGRFCVHYFSKNRDEDVPQELIEETEHALKTLFGATTDVIYWRTRKRRDKREQYEKNDEKGEFFTVHEYGVKFKINLEGYLDTGLFLDHRETRRYIANASKGKRLLNLFAYTCSFSVQAAKAGAAYTKSVDMSNTYTEWGRDNFLLNNIPLKNHPIVRADCLKFLDEEVGKYDLIIIDPPTISRSKKMTQMFDIQEDYPTLLFKSLRLLTDDGTLFFSTNSRKFHFDPSLFPEHFILDVSDKTIPLDFHDPKIHRCWRITRKTDTD